MKKFLEWLCAAYKWVTFRIPLRILHFVICFIVALLSWECAIGLALGRESIAFNSPETLKDSFWDFVSDIIGIALGVTIRCAFNLI